ncbi:MAG TPA: energy transducer TonB [Pyrinomonadaceae bacterium]
MMRAVIGLRILTPALLLISLLMPLTAACAQTLNSRSFDTPVATQNGPARNSSVAETGGWIKVAPIGEEFTVLMPSRPSLRTEGGKNLSERAISFYSTLTEGDMYMVSSAPKASGAGERAMLNPLAGEYQHPFFKQIREQGGQLTVKGQRDLALKGQTGREYRLAVGGDAIPCVTRVYLTGRRVYTLIWLSNREDSPAGEPRQEKFLESFTLGPINSDAAASNVIVEDERISGEGVGGGIGVGHGNGAGFGVGGSIVSRNTGGGEGVGRGPAREAGGEKIYSPRDAIQRARIVSKPVAEYTELARKNNVSGTVVLKMVLAADGTVKNIRAVVGLPYGLTERAINAARRIKFVPAMKDGLPVSQYAVLEYNFNLY